MQKDARMPPAASTTSVTHAAAAASSARVGSSRSAPSAETAQVTAAAWPRIGTPASTRALRAALTEAASKEPSSFTTCRESSMAHIGFCERRMSGSRVWRRMDSVSLRGAWPVGRAKLTMRTLSSLRR